MRIIEGHEAANEFERMGDEIYWDWWLSSRTSSDWKYKRACQLWQRADELRARLRKDSAHDKHADFAEPILGDLAHPESSDSALQLEGR